jgi:hypothetical protein
MQAVHERPGILAEHLQPAETSRKPVPDEFGFGITTWSLYSGLVRSFQLFGAGRLSLAASAVLKQIAAT